MSGHFVAELVLLRSSSVSAQGADRLTARARRQSQGCVHLLWAVPAVSQCFDSWKRRRAAAYRRPGARPSPRPCRAPWRGRKAFSSSGVTNMTATHESFRSRSDFRTFRLRRAVCANLNQNPDHLRRPRRPALLPKVDWFKELRRRSRKCL